MAAAQSVVRALKLLRLIMHQPGLRFSELVSASGMDKSNVQRVLKALEQEAFVYRDSEHAAYHPLISDHTENNRQRIRSRFRNTVSTLASLTGDTVLLMSREGDHVVCLDRQSGDYPVKALTTEVGQVRIMGVGSGGLSILSSLSDEEIKAFLKRQENNPALINIGTDQLRREIDTCRANGYASVGDRITPGTGSVGKNLKGADFNIALCVVSLTDRINGERTEWLIEQISQAIQAIPSLAS